MNSKSDQNRASSLSFDEARHLQTLESNPLDGDQVAMFAMFERENWSPERRRAHIQQRVLDRIGVPAAE